MAPDNHLDNCPGCPEKGALWWQGGIGGGGSFRGKIHLGSAYEATTILDIVADPLVPVADHSFTRTSKGGAYCAHPSRSQSGKVVHRERRAMGYDSVVTLASFWRRRSEERACETGAR